MQRNTIVLKGKGNILIFVLSGKMAAKSPTHCDKIDVWSHTIFSGKGGREVYSSTVIIMYAGVEYRFTKEKFAELIWCNPEELGENGNIADSYRDKFNEWAERVIHATLALAAE